MALVWLGVSVLNRRSRRVTGDSMEPALRRGDVLVVLPRWVRWRVGHVVVARDPRLPSRELIKRVVSIDAGGVVLHGDRPDRSTDSRTFGAVPEASVLGRAVRVWPPRRRATAVSHPRPIAPGD